MLLAWCRSEDTQPFSSSHSYVPLKKYKHFFSKRAAEACFLPAPHPFPLSTYFGPRAQSISLHLNNRKGAASPTSYRNSVPSGISVSLPCKEHGEWQNSLKPLWKRHSRRYSLQTRRKSLYFLCICVSVLDQLVLFLVWFTFTAWNRSRRVHELHADKLLAEQHNVLAIIHHQGLIRKLNRSCSTGPMESFLAMDTYARKNDKYPVQNIIILRICHC